MPTPSARVKSTPSQNPSSPTASGHPGGRHGDQDAAHEGHDVVRRREPLAPLPLVTDGPVPGAPKSGENHSAPSTSTRLRRAPSPTSSRTECLDHRLLLISMPSTTCATDDLPSPRMRRSSPRSMSRVLQKSDRVIARMGTCGTPRRHPRVIPSAPMSGRACCIRAMSSGSPRPGSIRIPRSPTWSTATGTSHGTCPLVNVSTTHHRPPGRHPHDRVGRRAGSPRRHRRAGPGMAPTHHRIGFGLRDPPPPGGLAVVSDLPVRELADATTPVTPTLTLVCTACSRRSSRRRMPPRGRRRPTRDRRPARGTPSRRGAELANAVPWNSPTACAAAPARRSPLGSG